MNAIDQLTKELNEMNAKRNAIKAANTVTDNASSTNRSFSYRSCIIIKASDVCSL